MGGQVEGLFIADDQTILGKHSEVYGTLGAEDLTVITDNPEHIRTLEELFENPTLSGYNPLDYIDEEEED